jgi:malate dehydrogenase
VGATCADVLAHKEAASEVVLLDIREGLAEGKPLISGKVLRSTDLIHIPLCVTDDYEATANSNVVVITSGLPRKPGMTRDDLIEVNAVTVKKVTENIIKYSPNTIIIVVSNPLDVMTYQSYITSNLPRTRVMGMAGVLDTGRYRAFIASELNISPKDIQAVLMGGHGDTMVPLPRYTTICGIPMTELLSQEKIDSIIERTKFGGGELVKLMALRLIMLPVLLLPEWLKL